MNQKVLIAVPVALLALGAISTQVFAQTNTGRQNLVQQLSLKLGISEDKVQAAFNEIQSDRQAEMEKTYEDRLTQLVTDGKITENQKQKILAKHQEIVKQKQSTDWQNMNPIERKTKLNRYRADIEKWAKDNGIDVFYLLRFEMHGDKGFGRDGKGFGHSVQSNSNL